MIGILVKNSFIGENHIIMKFVKSHFFFKSFLRSISIPLLILGITASPSLFWAKKNPVTFDYEKLWDLGIDVGSSQPYPKKKIESEWLNGNNIKEYSCKDYPVFCPSIGQFFDSFSPDSFVSSLIPLTVDDFLRKFGISLPMDLEKLAQNKLKENLSYNASSYPGFNPKLIFNDGFSLGEIQRIKKSFILVKIVLNSPEYLALLKNSEIFSDISPRMQANLGIRIQLTKLSNLFDFQFPNFSPMGSSPSNVTQNPMSKVTDIYNALLNYSGTLYLSKSSSGYKLAHTIKNPSTGFYEIQFNYGGKILGVIHKNLSVLPIVLAHQIMHALDFPNVHKHSYDATQLMIDLYFTYVYAIIQFPKIDEKCYVDKTSQC